ncbi:hypothetical protein KCP73_07815 [Salmonella enterica subsp. enterica]|nr:hypothetical protein KCP73_07815 [Salmonella enterica subsp. enterica]
MGAPRDGGETPYPAWPDSALSADNRTSPGAFLRGTFDASKFSIIAELCCSGAVPDGYYVLVTLAWCWNN